MRIAYHRVPWALDLAEQCGGLDGVAFTPVDSMAELEAATTNHDALVISAPHYTPELADRLGEADCGVRWLQFMTAGFETADRHGVPQGIAVTNASAAWGPVVAEHAVTLLLACLRRVPDMERLRLRETWDRPNLLKRLQSLEGARVGILGFGAIGAAIAPRLLAFDADVVAFARTPRPVPGIDGVHRLEDLPAMLPDLDALISALPLTEATHGLIDASLLGGMKPDSVLVNVGRGATVDEDALWDWLTTNSAAAAGLDVVVGEPLKPGSRLWQLDNVILSPHVAGFGSRAAALRLARLCYGNIERFMAGSSLIDEVQPVRRTSPAAMAGAPESR